MLTPKYCDIQQIRTLLSLETNLKYPKYYPILVRIEVDVPIISTVEMGDFVSSNQIAVRCLLYPTDEHFSVITKFTWIVNSVNMYKYKCRRSETVWKAPIDLDGCTPETDSKS